MAYLRVDGWTEDVREVMQRAPDYFVWWYTVKSIGFGAVAALAAYYIGKYRASRGRG